MSLWLKMLGSYYKFMYRFSVADDREKYLLQATNLLLRAKGYSFSLDRIKVAVTPPVVCEEYFPSIHENDEEVGPQKVLPLRKAELAEKRVCKEYPFPSEDGFSDNIALFLTAPEN